MIFSSYLHGSEVCTEDHVREVGRGNKPVRKGPGAGVLEGRDRIKSGQRAALQPLLHSTRYVDAGFLLTARHSGA